jgi:hypothetical protein
MKQKVDPSIIANELKEGSVFFQRTQSISEPSSFTTSPSSEEVKEIKDVTDDTTVSRHHDTMTPNDNDIIPKEISSVSLPYPEEMIEKIRSAVKQLGRAAATYRFTDEEKKSLAHVQHEYEVQNIRTSENQITRIAINFILQDYELHKENSILSRAIESLNK